MDTLYLLEVASKPCSAPPETGRIMPRDLERYWGVLFGPQVKLRTVKRTMGPRGSDSSVVHAVEVERDP